MSRSLIVTGSVELQLDRLAEQVAQRTAVLVVGLLRAGPGGIDSAVDSGAYERGADPGAGARGGARFGAVTDHGTEYDQP